MWVYGNVFVCERGGVVFNNVFQLTCVSILNKSNSDVHASGPK